MIGTWETAETRPCHLASAARRPRRGRIRTRARPSRLRAIAARKLRDETRPSGGEIAEKQLQGAESARMLCYILRSVCITPVFSSVGVLLQQSRGQALFFWSQRFLVLDRHDYRVTACVHRRNTGRTSRIATLLCCLSVLASRVVILFRLYWPGEIRRKWGIS